MNGKRLKWILIGSALVAVPVLVGIFGVSIVQASPELGVIGSARVPGILAHPGVGDRAVDMQALLADALGISVEELVSAQQAAREAAMAQLVEEGVLSEEQVEQVKAEAALKAYLDQPALHAEALGMSTEEWEAAKEAGKSLSEILEDQGMDAAAYRENLAAAHEAAVEQAVIDGIITQEQADNLGRGRSHGFGPGREFGRGRGGFKGELPEGFEPGDGFHRGQGRWHPFGPAESPWEDTSNTTNA